MSGGKRPHLQLDSGRAADRRHHVSLTSQTQNKAGAPLTKCHFTAMAKEKKVKLTDVHRGLLQRVMAEKVVSAVDMNRVLSECKEAFAAAGPGAQNADITVYSAIRDINKSLENVGLYVESESRNGTQRGSQSCLSSSDRTN